MFGRRNKAAEAPRADDDADATLDDADATRDDDDTLDDDAAGQNLRADGPYDSSEVPESGAEGEGHLDLGSVRLPLVEGAQIQVEMDEAGQLRTVHLLTEVGRITVNAFAAPRSDEMWPEVVGELAASLQEDGATVRFEDGLWGREVVGAGEAATMRFIGVDGPRWMVRCVAAGPDESQEPLAELARSVLQGTVVVRGDEPMPVRTPLDVQLPEVLAQQLEQARQEQAAGEQAAGEQAAGEQAGDGQPPPTV